MRISLALLLTNLLFCGISGLGSFAAEASKTPVALEIGSVAPEWPLLKWLDSDPITLKSLRGKVVLVRWWTAPLCPYCRATAPALNKFHEQFSEKGLRVIGVYHHKIKSPLLEENVKRIAGEYGFKFPIAIDGQWSTLKDWWLTPSSKDKWTSVSFLIDREGIVRYIHPGGQYVKGDGVYEELEKKITELLK